MESRHNDPAGRSSDFINPRAQQAVVRGAAIWLVHKARATSRAMAVQGVYVARYLAWRTRHKTRQPPPVPPGGKAELRAAVGGATVLVFVLLLLIAGGVGMAVSCTKPTAFVPGEIRTPDDPAHPIAAAGGQEDQGAVATNADEDSSWPYGSFAEDQFAEHDPSGPTQNEDIEQREVGVRVPIGVQGPSFIEGPHPWSSIRRRYDTPGSYSSGFDPAAGTRAELARQQAIERAQYEANRTMRRYSEQISGQMGAMGLQLVPEGSGYGRSYGPSPAAGLPPVMPYGNMPSAYPPGASPWGR